MVLSQKEKKIRDMNPEISFQPPSQGHSKVLYLPISPSMDSKTLVAQYRDCMAPANWDWRNRKAVILSLDSRMELSFEAPTYPTGIVRIAFLSHRTGDR